MHFIDKSYIFCVLVSFPFFVCLFFFLAQRIDCFSINFNWGNGEGEGGEGECEEEVGRGREKCIMRTTACIKEEQCIGPGSGGGMWRRLRSSPACLNQKFQKPERVGGRASRQTVFDAPPSLLSSLLRGRGVFSGNP